MNFNDSHIPICNVNFINGINTSQVFYCPNCGKRLKVNQRQCECGQLLRWDIEGGKTMQLNDIVKLAAKEVTFDYSYSAKRVDYMRLNL